jgi:hypothetical protein
MLKPKTDRVVIVSCYYRLVLLCYVAERLLEPFFLWKGSVNGLSEGA